MTESEWQSCADPEPMRDGLRHSGMASERKLRLFSAACCRRIWPLLTDERSRRAVELTERFADGQIGGEDLRQARNEAYRAWEDASSFPDDPGEPPDKVLYGSSRPWRRRPYEDDPVARRYLSPQRGSALFHAAYAAYLLAVSAVERALSDIQEAVWFGTSQGQRSAVATEEQGQSNLLRDIFGPLPFRQARIDSCWLAWNDGTVKKQAQAIYEGRALSGGTLDSSRLAVLADALEDAGCDNEEILLHCRQQGKAHVRGCWVLDLILGK
jgi:hypothetical protein